MSKQESTKKKVFSTLISTSATAKVLTEDEMCNTAKLVETVVRAFGEPANGIFTVYGQVEGEKNLLSQYVSFVHEENSHTPEGLSAYDKRDVDPLKECVKNGEAIKRGVQMQLARTRKPQRSQIYGREGTGNKLKYMYLDTDNGTLFTTFIMNGHADRAIQEIYCITFALALIHLRPNDKTLQQIYVDIMSGGWGDIICLKQIDGVLRTKLAEGIIKKWKDEIAS